MHASEHSLAAAGAFAGCNAHVGQGFDYHYVSFQGLAWHQACRRPTLARVEWTPFPPTPKTPPIRPLVSMQHGDPFGGASTSCLYSSANYASPTVHPPLIGWGMDGFPIHGRHLDSANLGQAVALDDCGGHQHEGVSDYHYHAQLVQATSPQGGYTAYVAGPYNCWRGDVSKVTNFWDLSGKPTVTVGYGAGRLSERSDYVQLQPCCGAADGYAAAGYSINGAGQQASPGGAPPPPPPTTPTPLPSPSPPTPLPSPSPESSPMPPSPSPPKPPKPATQRKSPPPPPRRTPKKSPPPPRRTAKKPPPSKQKRPPPK